MSILSWQKNNKYNARKTVINGKTYDSIKEGNKALELEHLKKSGKITNFESHVSFVLRGQNGTAVCKYIADFVVTHTNGTIEIIDVKSKITATSSFRLKWKLLSDHFLSEVQNGTVVLTIEY